MHIQLTTTQTSGKKDVVAQQHVRGRVLQIQAVPGAALALEIDGQPISGATLVKGKKPVLIRHADDLVVIIDDEPVAVVGDFFTTPDVTLEGNDWVLSQAAGEAIPAEGDTAAAHDAGSETADKAAADDGSSSSLKGLYWALGAAGLIGGIAAASGGGGGGSGKGGGAAAGPQTTVSGVVVAGPLVEGHGLKVTLYKADGTVLAGPVNVDATGKFTASFDRSYTGAVVAKVTDADGKPDYLDEASNAPKDLSGELRAIFAGAGQAAFDVVISPMSELAARVMGLAAGETKTGGLTVEQINAANTKVAEQLGLEGGLFAPVVPVVDAKGAPVAAPNNAGLALAALAGLEQLHGADGALDLLAQAATSADATELTGLLIAGSREAGLAANRDYADEWAAAMPDSKLAEVVHSASLLSSATIQGWTADTIGEQGNDVIAALTPAQVGLLTDDAIAGLTVGQLQVMNSGALAVIMNVLQLTQAQANSLSPEALALALNLQGATMLIRNDLANPAREVAQVKGQALTNDTTPSLSGSLSGLLPEGAHLAVYNGETKLGTAVMGANNRDWTFTPASALVDGVYQLELRVETANGKTSLGSTPVALTIDTVPAVLTFDTPVATDGLISMAERTAGVKLSGTAPDVADGTDITVGLAGTAKVVQVKDGLWQATFAAAEIPERFGNVEITLSTTDKAGNTATAKQEVGLRTVLPTVVIDTPVADDNRVVAPEKARGVDVSGTVSNLADGQTVSVVWGNVTKTAQVVDKAWTVNFASSEVPADGNTTISASAKDEVGNVSPVVSQAVVVNTAGDWILVGTVSGNDLINATEHAAGVTLAGTTSLANGQQLTVRWGDFEGTAAVANGAWTLAVPTASIPAEGTTPVTVAGQGPNAAITTSKSLTVDMTAPAAPQLRLANDLGASDSDGISSVGTFNVVGLEPKATWQYSLDNGATWKNGTGTSFVAAPAVYAAGAIQVRQTDQAGNQGVAGSNAAQVNIDTTVPTLVITSNQAALIAGQTATLTFTFSEPVSGFTLNSIDVKHGTLSNLVASGANAYTAVYTPNAGLASAAESVSVPAFKDFAGNPGKATTAATPITLDTRGPSVEITSDKKALKAGETATIRFVFSEALGEALQINDIRAQNGVLSNLQRSAEDPKVYTATYTPNAGQGNAVGVISVTGASVSDAVGNPGTDGRSPDITIDSVAPTLTAVAVTGINAIGQNVTTPLAAGDKVRVVMTMSENAVVKGGVPSYTIDVGGQTKTAVFNAQASSGNRLVFDYVIAAGDTDNAGGITATETALQLNGAVISDAAGNAATISVVPPIAANANTVAVDTSTVRLASAEIASATGLSGNSLNAGDVVTVRAVFTEVVNVTGAPQLGLMIGGKAVQAAYAAGSGSKTLTFTYTILAGETAADGISIPANALTLNNGQINNAAGTAAGLQLTATTANAGYLVDTTAPTVTGVVISGVSAGNVDKAGALAIGDKIRVLVTMSEAVNVPQGTVYNIDLNGTPRAARYVGSSTPGQLIFEYVVARGDAENTQGVTSAANAMVLPRDTRLTDLAGNVAAVEMPIVAAGSNAISIDLAGPATRGVTVAATDANGVAKAPNTPAAVGDKLVFTVAFDEAATVSGTPTLAFNLGAAGKQATYVSGSASTNLVFEYQVQAGDHGTLNQLGILRNALQLPDGATIVDGASNAAQLGNLVYTPSTQATPLVEGRQATVSSVVVQSATGAQGDWLNVGDTVTLRVTFSQPVTLTAGQANLSFKIGEQTVSASYTTLGTSTQTLDFTYTIAAGQQGPLGISIPANALTLSNGGALTAGGNAVALASTAVAANPAFRVDTSAPEINAVLVTTTTAANVPKTGALVAGDKVRVVVQASENVDVVGVPTFGVTVNNLLQQATYVSGTGTKNLVFEYTVPAGGVPAGNISVAANALVVAEGTSSIKDPAGHVLGQNVQVLNGTAGKLNLTGAGVDKLVMTPQLLETLTADRSYWVRLGQADMVDASRIGGVEYGRWTDSDGVVYDRHWTSGTGANAVHLYAQGGKAELGLDTATVAGSTVTIGLDGTAVAGAMAGDSWEVVGGGTVNTATLNEAGNSVTLALSAAPAGILDLRFSGEDLKTDADLGLRYTRLLVGTANAEALDGSAYTGNQALFANGGGGAMTGGAGSDLLVSGAGVDTMVGGAGADIFKWTAGSTGADTISDFTLAQGDKIDLSDLAFANLDRSNVSQALRLTNVVGTDNAQLQVDVSNSNTFGADVLTITITNGWTAAGGMGTPLQDLVNQGVIKV